MFQTVLNRVILLATSMSVCYMGAQIDMAEQLEPVSADTQRAKELGFRLRFVGSLRLKTFEKKVLLQQRVSFCPGRLRQPFGKVCKRWLLIDMCRAGEQ